MDKDGKSKSTYDDNILIMEIYLNNKNTTATHLDMAKGDFSHYTANKEVMLMPMFTFQVTNSRKVPNFKVGNVKQNEAFEAEATIMTLVEVPFQNLI